MEVILRTSAASGAAVYPRAAKRCWPEKRTKLTSSTAGLEAIMSEMWRSTARVGCDGLCFLTRTG